MGDVRYALTIFAVLAGIMILVAYYAGTTKVIPVIGSNLNSLFLTAQGRNANGSFPAYPASGSGG